MKKSQWTDYIFEMEKSKSPQVPTHIWDNIVPHLPQPKKDRKPIFLLLSLVLIASSIVSYNTLKNTSTQNNEASKLISIGSSNIENQYSNVEKSNTRNQFEDSNTNDALNLDETILSNIRESKSKSKNILATNKSKIVNRKINSFVIPTINSDSEGSVQQINTSNSINSVFENQAQAVNQPTFSVNQLENSKIVLLPIVKTPYLLLNTRGDCYEFNKKSKPKYSIDIYAGPQYSPNKFKAKTNESSYSAGLRESTESANLSFLFGVRANVAVSNLMMKAGLEYQNIYNQLNHVIGFDTSITVRTLNGQVIGVDTVYGKRTIKNHNYHRLVSLPISIGYQKKLRENSLQINAGFSLNLWMQSTGALLDSRLRPVHFNSPLDIYKSSLGFSPFINLQWSGPIMHNLRYFVEPQFQLNPSFDNSSYGIKHTMNSYQLKFGLQYLFQ